MTKPIEPFLAPLGAWDPSPDGEDEPTPLEAEDIHLLMLSDDGLKRLALGPGKLRNDDEQD